MAWIPLKDPGRITTTLEISTILAIDTMKRQEMLFASVGTGEESKGNRKRVKVMDLRGYIVGQ